MLNEIKAELKQQLENILSVPVYGYWVPRSEFRFPLAILYLEGFTNRQGADIIRYAFAYMARSNYKDGEVLEAQVQQVMENFLNNPSFVVQGRTAFFEPDEFEIDRQLDGDYCVITFRGTIYVYL